MMPIALLLGMPRAATTFLYHHFDSHPDIYVPYRRKTNFFSLHYNRYSPDWFFDHFSKVESAQVVVDTETIGFVDKTIDVIGNIDKVLDKQAKFILCVREPGEWLYSLYSQVMTFDKKEMTFEDFISGQYVLNEDGLNFPFNYQNGDIKKRIKSLIEHFGDRILLLDYKEIQDNANNALIKIECFLGVSPHFKNNPVNSELINASNRKNIRLLTALMRHPAFIGLASRLPVSLVKKLRKMFDRFSQRSKPIQSYSRQVDVAMARERYNLDVEYYHQLFSRNDESQQS